MSHLGSLWGGTPGVTFESLLGHFNSLFVSLELGGRRLHNHRIRWWGGNGKHAGVNRACGCRCIHVTYELVIVSQRFGDRKSLSIAKNHPKSSQEFSEHFGPAIHKMKGSSGNSPPKVHPNFAQNLGRQILGRIPFRASKSVPAFSDKLFLLFCLHDHTMQKQRRYVACEAATGPRLVPSRWGLRWDTSQLSCTV